MLKAKNHRRILLALAVIVMFTSRLLAHDYWLEPQKSQLALEESAVVELRFGENFGVGEGKPLDLARTTEFRLYGQSRKFIDLLARRPEKIQPPAQIPLSKEGTSLVTMERSPAEISFGRRKFLEYSSQEGFAISNLELPETTKRVNENYTRYLKTLLQVGATPSKTALKTVGQKYEIIPLTNPYGLGDGKLICKVLFDHHPAVGVKVSAIQRLGGKLTSASTVTDRRGRCVLAINPRGSWLIRSVRIIADSPASTGLASYHSYWASLTFAYN